jgi:hypothetical protein
MADLFTPMARYDQQWCGAVAIFSPGVIPTVDFYLTARLDNPKVKAVFRFEDLAFNTDANDLPVGTFIVIVRHTSGAWLDFIKANQQRWSGVAYLMDDDIPAAWWCRDIPLDYALWTTGRYWLTRKSLAKVCDRIWVSTAVLKTRYQSSHVALLRPQYVGTFSGAASVGCRRWAYHGTRMHQREMKWLVPIVAAVQTALPEAEFEVFGDVLVERLFKDIPRVNVMPPLPWADYLRHCASADIAVGLAPMLDGRFNAARSYSKAFDIARCGAVGVFSDSEPYADLNAGAGATVLQNTPDAWVQAIIKLLQDDDVRRNNHQQFLQWIKAQFSCDDLSTFICASANQ